MLNHQQNTKFQVMAAGVFNGIIGKHKKQEFFHFYNWQPRIPVISLCKITVEWCYVFKSFAEINYLWNGNKAYDCFAS